MQRCEVDVALGSRAADAGDPHRRRTVDRVLDQGGQPHAQLTSEHERAAPPSPRCLDELVERRTLLLAIEQLHPADLRPSPGHGVRPRMDDVARGAALPCPAAHDRRRGRDASRRRLSAGYRQRLRFVRWASEGCRHLHRLRRLVPDLPARGTACRSRCASRISARTAASKGGFTGTPPASKASGTALRRMLRAS
jgi:hypothetical protein